MTKTQAQAAARASELSPNQVKILSAIRDGKEHTRSAISTKTGIKKGMSRLLGAVTLEGFGAASDSGLEPNGFVTSAQYEGDRALHYTITAKGRKALDAALKASNGKSTKKTVAKKSTKKVTKKATAKK